jgi:hypothetical protein
MSNSVQGSKSRSRRSIVIHSSFTNYELSALFPPLALLRSDCGAGCPPSQTEAGAVPSRSLLKFKTVEVESYSCSDFGHGLSCQGSTPSYSSVSGAFSYGGRGYVYAADKSRLSQVGSRRILLVRSVKGRLNFSFETVLSVECNGLCSRRSRNNERATQILNERFANQIHA